MANYTDAQIIEIAAINENEHLGILTDCGISRDWAMMIVKMSTIEITAGLAQFANKPVDAQRRGFMDAAARELIIRKA